MKSLTANHASVKGKGGKKGRGRKDVSHEGEKPKTKGRPKGTDDEGKKKRVWKQTALKKAWQEFRGKYLKDHKESGKTVQQLSKEAGLESES